MSDKKRVSPDAYARMQWRFVIGGGFVGRFGQRSNFRWYAGEYYGHDPSHVELVLFFATVPHPAFEGATARDLFCQRFERVNVKEDKPLDIMSELEKAA